MQPLSLSRVSFSSVIGLLKSRFLSYCLAVFSRACHRASKSTASMPTFRRLATSPQTREFENGLGRCRPFG